MRGPWTSGGIEFNFGIIGHHPSTANAVDYFTRTNDDGSVSCIVGNTDLPSNTRWTVEIRLEKDKAYFETNASWYNASPVTASYYNWMTAAAVATYDLEFFIPGDQYVEHNGDPHDWPVDPKGRDLSHYKNNTFGPSKSYHIVGEYNDFFGGYYHDSNFGFGQWAPYEEMPGQKLWLWDLSRAGGIWEDLLTDSDGQYIEFQAGRLFDQYSPSEAVNPISQVGFDPYVMDRWSEIWFPFKEIGGMVDASEHGVLNLEYTNQTHTVGLNALQNLNRAIQIKRNGEVVVSEQLNLKPMEVYSTSFASSPADRIEISVEGTELDYDTDPQRNLIKRPFEHDKALTVSRSEQLLFAGVEALEFREFNKAFEHLSELLQIDPSHKTALLKMAELEFRRTNYTKALEHANAVLRMDTYDSGANYMAGIAYRAQHDQLNALESLGWAARDIKYRSLAFAQMAELYLSDANYSKSAYYARKALDFNTYNVNAREVLLILARLENDDSSFEKAYTSILEVDPLNHLATLERKAFGKGSDQPIKMKNEFKEETQLQSAINYHLLGLDESAITTLKHVNYSPKNDLWMAYLLRGNEEGKSESLLAKMADTDIDFIFPYRRETLPVLQWAITQNPSWKLRYLLAQNYLAVGLEDKGKAILKDLGTQPDDDVFYRFRSVLLEDTSYDEKLSDIQKALELNKKDWKIWEETIQFYQRNNKSKKALETSTKAYKKFADNYNIGLAHANALLKEGAFEKVTKVLSKIQILPYEHASESRKIYEQAYIGVALKKIKQKNYNAALSSLQQCKQWPENIGVGKPYGPDERIQDYLLAISHEALNNSSKMKEQLQLISDYTKNTKPRSTINNLFSLLALKKLGEQKELNKLSKRLTESTSKVDKLVMAFYKNDGPVLNELKGTSGINQNLWNAMQTAVGQ